jgi:hypothetical protein
MQMNKGLVSTLIFLVLLFIPFTTSAEGEIYKVVDADGNVTFTDQRPSSSAQPLDLPPLSVIETDMPEPEEPDASADAAESAEEEAEPTPQELRRQFSDFRISRPLSEETFWGTENSVVVTWESAQPIPPTLRVRLYVDGQAQEATGAGSTSLTLDRGEHQVYAELRDERNRRVAATETVTFFIQQHSVNRNRPGRRRPNSGP